MNGSFNHFPQLAAALKPALQRAITETIEEIEQTAKDFAPRDTGFLEESIYSVAPDGTSTYGATPTREGSYLLPEETPGDDMTGIVGVGANYGMYVEYGTRYMGAEPYFTPAVEAGRATLDENLRIQIDSAWGGP